VSAWTRDAVPSRFAYGGNKRVGPVVIAADVGWTLCGANASANADKASGETGEYAHERDWSAEHSACVASLRAAAGHRGAHGFDNDAPEMRAVFIARGPSFRKDGARLSVGEGDGGDGFEVTALTGRDADASAVAARGSESDASVDRDAVAAAWEPRTFVFDNTAVFPIAARALGFDLKDDTDGFAALDDGNPFPRVDGVLSASLRDALFDVASGGKIKKRRNAVGADVASFLAAAAASFAAFHLLDRRATGSWPFEKAHALLTLESASDAERQLPETEAGGAARGGATSLGD
jgi:ectonucleotide pyrophosphatase/phosphodiesterase family protein 4